MQLTTPDIYRIIAIAIGGLGLITGPTLESFGLPQNTATHLASVAGFIVSLGTVISKIISTPSPQSGTNYAVIPQGTIPIVGTSTASGPSVGLIDPEHATVQPLQPKG